MQEKDKAIWIDGDLMIRFKALCAQRKVYMKDILNSAVRMMNGDEEMFDMFCTELTEERERVKARVKEQSRLEREAFVKAKMEEAREYLRQRGSLTEPKEQPD